MYGLTLLWPPGTSSLSHGTLKPVTDEQRTALFVMMSHMHAQRRKYLSKPSTGGSPSIKTPKPVKENVAKAEAEELKKKLEAAGAKVELK